MGVLLSMHANNYFGLSYFLFTYTIQDNEDDDEEDEDDPDEPSAKRQRTGDVSDAYFFLFVLHCCCYCCFFNFQAVVIFTNIFVVFFFFLGFLSQTFMIHRATREGGGYLFNSFLSVPPASQTLRHQQGDYCRELTSAHSQQPDLNQEPLVSEHKS